MTRKFLGWNFSLSFDMSFDECDTWTYMSMSDCATAGVDLSGGNFFKNVDPPARIAPVDCRIDDNSIFYQQNKKKVAFVKNNSWRKFLAEKRFVVKIQNIQKKKMNAIVCELVCQFLSVGAIHRLAATNRELRLHLAVILPHITALKLGVSARHVIRKGVSKIMTHGPNRCRECGKNRRRTRSRLPDRMYCLQCATDSKGFRFHPTRKQAERLFWAATGWNTRKCRFLELSTVMLTQVRKHLVTLDDVQALIARQGFGNVPIGELLQM